MPDCWSNGVSHESRRSWRAWIALQTGLVHSETSTGNIVSGGLETGPGFWAVFDEIDPIPSPRNPGYAPSCILARMSVAINMTDMFSSGSGTRTFFLPNNAVAMNETCGKTEQLLSLIWNQTHYGRVLDRMNLTMKFEKEEKAGTLLSQVSLEMYHNHYAGSKFVLEANEAVRLMHSPELFAFCCDEDLNIDLAGIITVFHENGPTQENVSLTLTLSNLCVESFRQSRYYEEITHLTYNCKYGWPYAWVEWAVNGTLAIFTLSILAAFILQNKKIKRLEAAALLLTDDGQSISNS